MIKRIVAWAVFGGLCFGAYTLYKGYNSPWGAFGSPVLSALPKAAPGCTEDCKR